MTSGWQVAAAAVPGRQHLRSIVGCQDAFAVRTDQEVLVVAVADGGTSAPLAGLGAQAAAALAVEVAWTGLSRQPADRPWPVWLRKLLTEVVATFTGLAREASRAILGRTEPNALGTTLTLIVARPPWVGVVSIGDGFVVVRGGADHLDLLLAPDDGTPPDPRAPLGRTVFVTSAHALQQARVVVARLPDLTGLAVSTDGLSEIGLGYHRSVAQQPHVPFFRPIFDRAVAPGGDEMALHQMLASARISRLTGDDRTLVVAVPVR